MTAVQARPARTVRVYGLVQGVGFRPFVHRLASELDLDGEVGNDALGVFIHVEGPPDHLSSFVQRLVSDAPTGARVETVDVSGAAPSGRRGFRISASRSAVGPTTLVPPDTAVCGACLAEMWDPADRRHLHPFITCTSCGPRFTIIEQLPYDRPSTTMRAFAMCPDCRAEYEDPSDRRYHAQPIGCHRCGPRLTLGTGGAAALQGPAALEAARAVVAGGGIVAVKGVGGYHLVCDATNARAVTELRRRKGRADKPFAVMVPDLSAAGRIAVLGPGERALLGSPARPIVLAVGRPGSLPAEVAPANPLVGVMVAYAPVHHLLFDEPDGRGGRIRRLGPLVVTSSNPSGEPITYRDDGATDFVPRYADAVLGHDRPIHVPCDDSVVRADRGRVLPLRRGRGYAPLPVRLPMPPGAPDVLAVGAEIKSAFCVASGGRAWMSPHIGDMGNLATVNAFEASVAHFCRLYGVRPGIVAVDSHPGYRSSRWAREQWSGRSPVVEVQHHHAHVAALIAEHARDPREPVLGFAFDGTGYGDDGAVWGGELLVASATTCTRRGHLAEVVLPGGQAAVEHPWRTALSHLRAAGLPWDDALPPVAAARAAGGAAALAAVEHQLTTRLASVPTTSMGRLFDAVASLLGVRQRVTYEAQAAIELEHLATSAGESGPDLRFAAADGVWDAGPVIAGVVSGLRSGVGPAPLSAAFHAAVARLVVSEAIAARDRSGLGTVALGGGVWQNTHLSALTAGLLVDAGFDVLTHRLVPPNDGGLALGQALVAAHRPAGKEG